MRGLRVLAWPARSEPDPAEAEPRRADDAMCRGTSDGTSRRTCTPKVTCQEVAEPERGARYVSTSAVAEDGTGRDGDTVFLPRAATFDVGR